MHIHIPYRNLMVKICPTDFSRKCISRIVNHRLNAYKRKAAELLTSEEGIRHRGRRCIEPEAVFGQIKNNMAYRRFRHFGKDKIAMDFSFFAIAFNIKKLCKRLLNGDYNNLQAHKTLLRMDFKD